MINKEDTSNQNFSYFSKSVNIKGDVEGDENLTIEGKVAGNIKNKKTLTIGKFSEIDAEINTTFLKIHGKLKGSANVQEKVELLKSGNFNGKIQCKKISIDEGAILKGYVNYNK